MAEAWNSGLPHAYLKPHGLSFTHLLPGLLGEGPGCRFLLALSAQDRHPHSPHLLRLLCCPSLAELGFGCVLSPEGPGPGQADASGADMQGSQAWALSAGTCNATARHACKAEGNSGVTEGGRGLVPTDCRGRGMSTQRTLLA